MGVSSGPKALPPIRNHNGEPLYFIGEVLDITERKQAEEVLSSVSRKLIEAQEQERTRIARELHDDINQRLALVAIDMTHISEDAGLRPRLRKRMSELASRSKTFPLMFTP